MPNYYYPGVYREEENKGPRPIEAVATAVAAFVGFAPYSSYEDANQPVLITSWTQYVEKFGQRDETGRKQPFMPGAYLSHAVYGYFLNGGTRCYVVRVVSPEWKTALNTKRLTAAPQQVLTRQAQTAKRAGEATKAGKLALTITPKVASLQDIEVSIDRAAGSQPSDCAIAVRIKMGDTIEEYKRIGLKKSSAEEAAAAQKAEEAAAATQTANQAAAAVQEAEDAKTAAAAAKKADDELAKNATADATAARKAADEAAKNADEARKKAEAADDAHKAADAAAAAQSADVAAAAQAVARQKADDAAEAKQQAEAAAAAVEAANQALAAAAAAQAAAKTAATQAENALQAAQQAADAKKTQDDDADAQEDAKESSLATPSQAYKEKLAFLNASSKLVAITQAERLAEADLAFGVYYLTVPQPDVKAKLLGGAPPNGQASLAQVQPRDIVGSASERTGVFGLEIAPDVTMVCCPDLMSPLAYDKAKSTNDSGQFEPVKDELKAVQLAMINHCELLADRIAILDAPREFDPQKVESWRLNTDGSGAGYDSMFAALYYPWITVANPLAGDKDQPQQIEIPPCGHIAGIYARNDTERGVHKSPANEIVRGALKLSREITNGEQAGLNPNGVNCIRSFPGRGIRVWGARTLTSDPAWRYVSVRRLFNMVEKSIERDTQWVVFEPNDPNLWSRVRRDVGAFLMTLWRDGMLFGNTPDQAFYVKCDAELNPPESRDLGRLIIEVGMAPVKPAEFVIFRFSQFTAEAA